MAKIIKVEVIDDTMRTTYDDGYFNETIIPKGYQLQARIVPTPKKKAAKHYKYAKCSAVSHSIHPEFVYSAVEVTCGICKEYLKQQSLTC